MRCPECQQEVVLARTCPYCGATVPQPEESERPAGGGQDHPGSQQHPRGRFQGRMEREGPRWDASASGGTRRGAGQHPVGFWGRLARYMVHPAVPFRSKLLVVLAGLYLLSPLDLIPGLPPISWLDDVSLMAAVWWWLSREFERFR
ncbi:DUF1232 domain-containing protein [Limnochorda pilosa]|uniref:DUF1232 domain-containing protein n=1 Tax=Limnochorda pilosa TaxID=1555112 RepID=A0A0K2SJR7_LIMPI|nr:DUF1232 domain-containing protein [Limnochorda pilosa]BAS27356.1 hypothetical protein LIP_1508 [Limnochorda pilosa]